MNRKAKYEQSEKGRETRLKWRKKIRDIIIAKYGGACCCCGETTPEFLVIDHTGCKRGNPATRHGCGVVFYRWLIKNNYPKEGLQLLCNNCNASLGYYGYCPHIKSAK
jgi:hypothetical protein